MRIPEDAIIPLEKLTAFRRFVPLRDLEAQEESATMTLPLYQRVALVRDLDEYRLKRGDVAVLIDRVPHPSGGEEGVVLEVFNALGASLAVVAVPESAIVALREDEVLSVRPLANVTS